MAALMLTINAGRRFGWLISWAVQMSPRLIRSIDMLHRSSPSLVLMAFAAGVVVSHQNAPKSEIVRHGLKAPQNEFQFF
ncbi:MAG TPA: hypothetical protein VJ692_00705 [Nitrospiraceae bacterium]|nr:hypothetical protein [Nitrospiraceae bacterium]